MRFRTLFLAMAAAALAPVAVAQKIPSAEAGVAPLALAEFSPPAETVTVKRGEVAWVEQVVPVHVVRLLDEVKFRPRPNAGSSPWRADALNAWTSRSA